MVDIVDFPKDLLRIIVKELDVNEFYSIALVGKPFSTICLEPPIQSYMRAKSLIPVHTIDKTYKVLYHILPNGVKEGTEESRHPNRDLDPGSTGKGPGPFPNGELCSLFMWKNGVKDGTEKWWHPNGELCSVYAWKDGIINRVDVWRNKNGHLTICRHWADGKWFDDNNLVEDTHFKLQT